MEGGINVNAVLDYAIFQISSTQNRYEALVCSKGKTEKVASGPLDQLALHLPQAKGFHSNTSSTSFKLQVIESLRGSSWFTKSTLARLLHIVNVPELLKIANAIENEMSQLEDARRFHLALYAKDQPDHSGGGVADTGCLNEAGLTHKIKVETASSDDTKNELLRAMDLRLMALREELASAFNRAAGATCSTKQISDLAAFSQHFGATDLRNSLLKYLALSPKDLPADSSSEQSTFSHDSRNNCGNMTEVICQQGSQIDVVSTDRNGISPAKIAQVERQSSTESEESSNSSGEDRSFAERSRPVIRSASPRRSASPMRRIQIGRSGSRRSTTLTIKSLNYFPARERTSSNIDADGNSSGDEEHNQRPKKPDNAVRRMSVQDAISLFENKQKSQNSDIQKRTSAEVSISTNKSVLRRWSAGMGDSFTQCPQEIVSDTSSQGTSHNLVLGEEERKSKEVKAESDFPAGGSNSVESAHLESLNVAKIYSPTESPADLVISKAEEINDQATASAEWNRQKEAELNQMLMKLMQNKPGKCRNIDAGSGGYQISSEPRGGFYSQYKEKRDEKLRAENAGKRAEKETQFKVMQETIDQRRAEMASKTSVTTRKQDSLNNSQRQRRNSSPPVLPKKETSKLTGSRKASPKPSPLPTTRNSWPLAPLLKTTATQPTKTSPGIISTNSTPNRWKPQPTPSPTRPSPRMERPLQQPRGKKETLTDTKLTSKGQEEKQQKTVTKTSKSVKTKNPSASGDDCGMIAAKPNFYSKVTKKSSVVPLESKPFLRKGTGVGPGAGLVLAKTKISQSDDSLKNSENSIHAEEKESTAVMAEVSTNTVEDDLVKPTNDVDSNLEAPLGNGLNLESTLNLDQFLGEVQSSFKKSMELPEIQPDEDLGISSAAWVEVERQEVSGSCDNGLPQIAISPEIAPVTLSSPHVRHSLSQMLQADSSEPEIIEWGNADNPPALVYQKDGPKGLKRLLKFARKNKGDSNVTGSASPSVFSEGEDDPEEPKAASKKNSDALLRKTALKAKGFGQQKTVFSESFGGGNSSKSVMDYHGVHAILSAQSSTSNNALGSDKVQEGHISATATSTKATRSFFSLSTFRSSKSSERKLR